MKPAPFAYEAPDTVEGALELMDRYGEAQKLLAGGQSLVPLMNMRLTQVETLIDLNRIPSLRRVTLAPDTIRIGAMTTQRQLERSDPVRQALPALAAATSYVGHPQIRSRGTIGGSIAHADPAAELPLALLVHDGAVVARSPRGERSIGADDFFVAHFTTALATDEMVTELVLPRPRAGTGWSFREVTRRHGDFALVAVAVLLALEGSRVARARIGVAGCGGRPVRIPAAEALLLGRSPDESAWSAAAERVSLDVRAGSDVHASSDHRRRAAGVLTRRALAEAASRVGTG